MPHPAPHHIFKLIIYIAVLSYIGIGLLLYLNQRRILYFPNPVIPDTVLNSITLPVEDAVLFVHVVRPGRQRALIYFGGNASAAQDSRDFFHTEFPDYTSYLPDYRGYGGSTGRPTQAALLADACTVFDEVSRRHAHVDVIGLSLGSGIAAFVAAERPVGQLALVTPYDSIRSVAQQRFPLYPMSLLLKDQYDTLSLVPRIRAPTLIVIADRDEMIPRPHSDALARAFPSEQLLLRVFEDIGHNELWERDDYRAQLREFFSGGETAGGVGGGS